MDNKLDGGSLDVERVELERLFAAFPQCFVEGKFDVKKLAALCGEYDDNDFEKYKFEWKGKDASLRQAQQRSMGTLRPCPAESVDWDTTQNLYIEGDNLEVLKQLQTAYYRRVKMIYIDPPYNTGNDFVYADDFADPIKQYKEITSQTTKSNPETMGRFHTNWLNMMYPRLRLAANLLTDDGVIFISIDDNEVHNLRKLCDEVFGEENFVAEIIWEGANKNDASQIGIVHEYVLVYSKNRTLLQRDWNIKKDGVESVLAEVSRLKTIYGRDYNSASEELAGWFRSMKAKPEFGLRRFKKIDECGAYKEDDPTAPGGRKFELINPLTNQIIPLRKNRGWAFDQKEFERMVSENKIVFVTDTSIMVKRYLHETDSITPPSVLYQPARSASERLSKLIGENIFDFPKDETIISKFIEMCSGKDDIILDFFSGSATTAHAVMQLNKEDGGNLRFILVQLPELTDKNSEAYKAGYKNICEIGKERIRRAGAKIAASDCHCGLDPQSTAGTTLFDEIADQVRNDMNQVSNDRDQVRNDKPVDVGFRVFKLDTSNLKTWDAAPVDSDDPQQMELLLDRMNTMIETIKTDRSDEDVVYEIMLKMGVPPTYSVSPVEIDGKRAYCVGDECLLLVCLQEGLTAATIERMAEDYLPSKMILSEKCFADDTAMANAHYILRDREIELKLV